MTNNNHEIWQRNHKERTDEYLMYSGGIRYQRYLIISILADIYDVDTILDIGCGSGDKAALLSSRFPQATVTGVDFCEEAIEKAESLFGNRQLKFICDDVTERCNWETYDLVTSFQVLEHLDNWEKMLNRICEMSNKYVLISVPTGRMRAYEVYEGHLRNFKKGEIENYMEGKGYSSLKVFYAGFPFYSPIERDLSSLFYDQTNTKGGEFSYSGMTKIIHDLVYFVYKNFNTKMGGDLFLGLFIKTKECTPTLAE